MYAKLTAQLNLELTLCKWDALYEEYRKDMTNVCSKAKDEVKHEVAEVLKIYKQVNFSGPPLSLYFQIFHHV